jgi:sugar phosphate isomerase/epimerase
MGVQLFTLFMTLDQDVKGNMQKIADLGYKDIESAFSRIGGFYGLSAMEFSDLNKSLGMNWVSHHAMGAPFKPRPGFDTSKMPRMNNLRDDAQAIVDSLKGTTVKYLVCANIPIESKEEVAEAVQILTKAGKIANAAGLTLCYHNHDREFEMVDGQKAFDVFSKEIPADLLKFELDLGWATKAGVDPVALFKAQPGRFPLCHIKDFDEGFKNIVPAGSGIINFKRILDASSIAGMKHFFIEHDMPKDAIESLTIGKKNIGPML